MNMIDGLTKLLNQTKDDCPECHGRGRHIYASTIPDPDCPILPSTYEDTCLTCSGTGKVGDWRLDRLVILDEDQSLPVLKIEDFSNPIHPHLVAIDKLNFEQGMQYLKQLGFRRIREIKK